MSSAWVKVLAPLCLLRLGLGAAGSAGVIWSDAGGSATIRCRSSKPTTRYIMVYRGLKRDDQVLFNSTVANNFKTRLKMNGTFPNMDIHISNLTSEDTGVYWCSYYSMEMLSLNQFEGNGSVILAVRDPVQEEVTLVKTWLLVAVIALVAVVMQATLCVILKIFQERSCRVTWKPKRAINGDIYEDMRSTVRRCRNEDA